MYQNEFSITLPSNSSTKFYPDNTTTSFSTRLPREIELHEKWQVGLAEIHIPCTTLHLRFKDTKISAEGEKELCHFQHGIYDSIHTLVQAINETLFEYHGSQVKEKLFYDEKGGYVSIREYTQDKKTTTLSTAVKRILGFETGGVYTSIPEDKNSVRKNYMLVANQPASLSHAIPDQLFVYSNICEPCIVGDAHAPLLRIVNLEANQYKYGSTIVKRYAPVSYIPLLNNRFKTIDIDIRDQFGKPIAFEFGTLTVTLHFKREF